MCTLWWELLGGHWVHTDLASVSTVHILTLTHPVSLWWINVVALLVNILGAVAMLMLLRE